MNKLTPYEQSLSEQLKDLPVPSSDEAWRQMELLLDKDNSRGPVAPVTVRRGCALPIVLLALLLAGIGAYFLHRNNWFRSADKPVASSTKDIKTTNERPVTTAQTQADHSPVASGSNSAGAKVTSGQTPEGTAKDAEGEDATASVTRKVAPGQRNVQIKNATNDDDVVTTKNEKINTPSYKQKIRNGKSRTDSKTSQAIANTSSADDGRAVKNRRSKNVKANSKITIQSPDAEETEVTKEETTIAKNDVQPEPVVIIPHESKTTKAPDVIRQADSTGAVTKTAVDTPIVKKEIPAKKYHFAAGMAVYKGLPTNGAIDAAVNNSGRKNAASDYIPSVYIRYLREKKWFLQGEFRYGVPQYTRAFEYKKNLKVDAQQTITTSSYKLRKTYYHQVPVSFNYFIRPGWSVGTGIMYNRFSGALSSESVRSASNRLVNDSLVSFNVIRDKNDSSFVKNTFQWLIETQYKWNRFSVGARYAKGLQPYIRYTDPKTNLPVSKRSNSLYLFLRYELWSGR